MTPTPPPSYEIDSHASVAEWWSALTTVDLWPVVLSGVDDVARASNGPEGGIGPLVTGSLFQVRRGMRTTEWRATRVDDMTCTNEATLELATTDPHNSLTLRWTLRTLGDTGSPDGGASSTISVAVTETSRLPVVGLLARAARSALPGGTARDTNAAAARQDAEDFRVYVEQPLRPHGH